MSLYKNDAQFVAGLQFVTEFKNAENFSLLWINLFSYQNLSEIKLRMYVIDEKAVSFRLLDILNVLLGLFKVAIFYSRLLDIQLWLY